MKRLLFVTDVENLLLEVKEILTNKGLINQHKIDFAYTPSNVTLANIYNNSTWIKPIDIKNNVVNLIENYDIIFSIHCQQLFPSELVNNVICINIHPGYNPFNRGWYPQIFSINNGLTAGVTIHIIDEEIDNGPIIYQEKIQILEHETSFDVYNKILLTEIRLLNSKIVNLIEGNYALKYPTTKGNLNYKKDYENLKKLDLNNVDTLANHLNLLRSMTHGSYKNAYFKNSQGERIYVKIILEKE